MTKEAAYNEVIVRASTALYKQAAEEGIDLDTVDLDQEEVGAMMEQQLQEMDASGAFDDIYAEVDAEGVEQEEDMSVEAMYKMASENPASLVEMAENEEVLGKVAAFAAAQRRAVLEKRANRFFVDDAQPSLVGAALEKASAVLDKNSFGPGGLERGAKLGRYVSAPKSVMRRVVARATLHEGTKNPEGVLAKVKFHDPSKGTRMGIRGKWSSEVRKSSGGGGGGGGGGGAKSSGLLKLLKKHKKTAIAAGIGAAGLAAVGAAMHRKGHKKAAAFVTSVADEMLVKQSLGDE